MCVCVCVCVCVYSMYTRIEAHSKAIYLEEDVLY
jgi:hypothetical protein